MRILPTVTLCLIMTLLNACSSKPSKTIIPEQVSNELSTTVDPRFDDETQPHHRLHLDPCALLAERPHWKSALMETEQHWGIPPSYVLAFMHQESRFNPKALSKSMAYGYPQAKDATWDWYQLKRRRPLSSRERFDDSADFIGWYAHQNIARNKVRLNQVREQYLAYHEGLGGYEKQSYLAKTWLMEIADKVEQRALDFHFQLKSCNSR